MNEETLSQVLLLAFSLGGIAALLISGKRKATDVFFDLQESDADEATTKSRNRPTKLREKDEVTLLGIFDAEEKKQFIRKRKLVPFLIALILILLQVLFGKLKLPVLVMTGVSGFGVGVFIERALFNRRKAAYKRKIEFFLPIVMERIVMAVQAGLDVLSALSAVLSLDKESSQLSDKDPVCELLRMVVQLTESGLSFEDALKDVSLLVECSSLRHAFIHLGVAHREGGELVMPLRELSDATQLYFQETIEEDIAKMPVKATIPLVVTFAGLIICFITTPIIQVMSITGKALGAH